MSKTLPANFEDPFGLVLRLAASRNRQAYSAVATTAGSVLLTPFDLLLSAFERRIYRHAGPPEQPLLIVTGAPRSGTTLVAQVLGSLLDVSTLNNLTQLFPRSPITANRLFAGLLGPKSTEPRSFYGRTSGLAGHNDGLHIWDRWWTGNRFEPPRSFNEAQRDGMRRFFGAWERAIGAPLLIKNNALLDCIDAVAEALPTTVFVCVERDPSYNAQSILVARQVIQGSRDRAYGVPAPAGWPAVDPIDEVCSQVLYHQARAREHQQRLGHERVRIVPYEDFCLRPVETAREISQRLLHKPLDERAAAGRALRLRASHRRSIAPKDFEAIVRRLQARVVPTERPRADLLQTAG